MPKPLTIWSMLALALTLLFVNFSVAPLAQAQEPTTSTAVAVSAYYQVGEGDVLYVEIYGEEDMSGRFTVGPGGLLNYPMVADQMVAGKTQDRIAEQLSQALAVDMLEDPRVAVRVEKCLSQRVYVLGAVNQPGEFYLCGPTRLLDVLARAGGVRDETVSRVLLTREEEAERDINYDDLVNLGRQNETLRSEDRIYVPEGLKVYVTGQVGEPGAIGWRKGLTLTQAINEASGLTPTARTRKVFILRDGERVKVRLNRILQGRSTDFDLQAGDQVIIAESAI